VSRSVCCSGYPGKFVDLPTTISSFRRIAAGEFDHLPEQAFYMVGPLKEVEEKAAILLKESAARAQAEKESEAKKKAAAASQ
jgi:F0F1-type ATP synthase beta subunit